MKSINFGLILKKDLSWLSIRLKEIIEENKELKMN